MISLFQRGGPVMIPLLICSLFAVAFIVERLIFWLRLNRSRDKKLVSDILDLCDAGKFDEAYEKGKESRDFVVYVLLNGIAHRAYSMEGAMEAASESPRIWSCKAVVSGPPIILPVKVKTAT